MSTLVTRVPAVVVGLVAVGALCAAPAQATGGEVARISLPAVTGRYQVGTTDLHLRDRARQDPWQAGRERELMATVSYPAAGRGGQRAAWMPHAFAAFADENFTPALGRPPGSVDWGWTRRPAREAAAVDRSRGRWPVVVFSHGFGAARELNAVLTDDLAAHGYVVVSVAHPGDASVVSFPDGRVVTASIDAGDPVAMKTAIDTRVADARFVLDALTGLDRGVNPDVEGDPLPRGLVGSLDLSRVGVFGHSYGGFAAAETMYHDQRFDAGINLDGGLAVGGVGEPGESAKHGVRRPFLLVGADTYDPATGGMVEHSTHVTNPSWALFWANQQGWKRDLHFDGAAHNGFSDFQVPDAARLVPEPTRTALLGTIDPARSVNAQRHYVAAFFDLHLKGRDRHVFDRADPRHPDTRFVP